MAGSVASLSTSRRQRLENIKQREDLKDHLVTKYRDKFGGGAANRSADQVSVGTAVITSEVNRLVGSSAPMTQANLAKLERRLQRKADGKGSAEDDVASQSAISSYSVASVAPSVGSRRPGSLTARGVNPNKPASLGATPPVALSARGAPGATPPAAVSARGGAGGISIIGDAAYQAPKTDVAAQNGQASLEWSVLDKLAAQLHKHDAAAAKSVQSELQQKLKRDLEKQMADYKLKLEREKQEDDKYLSIQAQAVNDWKDEEAAKKRSYNERIAQEREKVMEQMNLNQKIRDEERMKDKQEADEITTMVEKQLESDKIKAEEMLKRRQMQLQEALTISSKSSKLRDQREQEAREREQAANDEYLRLRDLRDKEARDQAALEKSNREKMAVVQATQVENVKLKDQAADAKYLAESAEMNRIYAERVKAKEDALAAKRQETRAYLTQQMQQKQAAKRTEEEQRLMLRVAQETDASNFEASERQKKIEKKMQLLEHSKELERQVASRVPSVSGKDCMSECELRLNKPLLESVTRALTQMTAS